MRIKKIFYSILAFVISIGLFNSCSYNNNQLSKKLGKSVILKGNAIINVKPDIAILKLGVNTTGKNIIDIKSQNNKIIDNIVDNMMKLGIDKKDIYVYDYQLYSYDDYNHDNLNKILDYNIYSAISVKVKDINNIEKIITEATKSGSTIINGIEFTVTDYNKYYKEALEKAIEDGNNKAKEMSKSLGVDLGSAVKIDEDQNSTDNNENNNNNFTKTNSGEKSNSVMGENKLIKASVNMTFEY